MVRLRRLLCRLAVSSITAVCAAEMTRAILCEAVASDDDPCGAPLPELPDPYAAAWADLHRRRLALHILYYPCAPLIGLGSIFLLCRLRLAGLVLLVPSWVIIITAQTYVSAFRCPRCEHHFRGRRADPVFWSNACHFCRLVVGTPKSAADA